MGFFSKSDDGKEDKSTKITVINNINKKNRAFYRAYILPRHIAKRDGPLKAAFEDELQRHTVDILANGLQEEYETYVQAQEDKQTAYDEWRRAESALSQAVGPAEIAEAYPAVSLAHEEYLKHKLAFRSQYH